MTITKTSSFILLATTCFLLFGCGTAHVKTDIQADNMHAYKNVLIEDVRVYSSEESAKTNAPLQEKLKDWELYSRQQLQSHVNSSKYTLVENLDEANGSTLLIDLDINVKYGNRALRWAVGFGAGKGGVDSTITVKDAETGVVKYKAQADSDLSMGGAGGDIGNVLKENISKLLKQYSENQI
ncbi:hypothetical protein Q6D67_21645 [Haliea sp. E1-2-M8]|uniref:hypothetical protein n=1 Tax=Haliea sp. E1-2-M8 TaxID=3064706 RepID=UPI0027239E7F|nr:hypothetical protein [Haliea sp. E1-2-M8]MDO8864275.1 hypothetical protein [Haliea sp. E1-2-M8]